jgi:hypothetical protein
VNEHHESSQKRGDWRLRTDLWVLAHPWRWGAVAGLLVAVILWSLGLTLPFAILGGAAWAACVAWSFTRGPGRRMTERRIERRRSGS